jgi:enoyl-CoA hydratase/carnithine racemase
MIWRTRTAFQGIEIMAVTTSIIGETVLVVMDRRPVNALDLDTIVELEDVFADAGQKAPRNGVVLTGAGQVFSAGVDTRAFAAYNGDQRHAMVRAITRMVARLLAIAKPVVAAVNGHALGGRESGGSNGNQRATSAARDQILSAKTEPAVQA